MTLNKTFWCPKLVFIAMIVLLALLFFYPLFVPGRCLFTTDDNLSIMPSANESFPSCFLGVWGDRTLFGTPGGRVALSWNPIVMGLLPTLFCFNWIHAIDLVLASLFLFFFLRANKLSLPAIALGVLTAFWVGSNLTLTYAGHLGKFAAIMFAAAGLYGIRRTFESDRPWLWSAVTGGLLGFMFLEQQDVALFFGLFWGAYALFRVMLLFQKGTWRKGFLLLIPMGVVALIMSGATLMSSYARNVGAADMARQDDPRQKWEFVTQWSWPPEESIDFIAPGYMGWRSGEPQGPYWGRMGRSAAWEKTGQGFMNFKLENQYLGAIPIIFAFFALFAAFFRGTLSGRKKLPQESGRVNEDLNGANIKAEVIFWFCAALLALLLSFGKYFPLYELFYKLPVVSNIRNPNKFLQIFQLALGILSAYGAHLIFNWRNTYKDSRVNF